MSDISNSVRRTRVIMPTLLAAAAVVAVAMLGGCSSDTTTARCVDGSGNVLPDSACASGSSGSYATMDQKPRWVYGGEGGSDVGSKATGYSTDPPSDGEISTPSGTVIRSGSGGEGEGHGGEGGHGGGGEGGGGGHGGGGGR